MNEGLRASAVEANGQRGILSESELSRRTCKIDLGQKKNIFVIPSLNGHPVTCRFWKYNQMYS